MKKLTTERDINMTPYEELSTWFNPKEKTVLFRRVKSNGTYYSITIDGQVVRCYEGKSKWGRARHLVANYCTDGDIMEQRALNETLNRLLWRYSLDNKDRFPAPTKRKFYIKYHDYCGGHWMVKCHDGDITMMGVTYFDKEETAKAAIKEVIEPFVAAHPEFKISKEM